MKNSVCTGVLAVAFLGLSVAVGQEKIDPPGKPGQQPGKQNGGKPGQDKDLRTLPAPDPDPAPWQLPGPPTQKAQGQGAGDTFGTAPPAGGMPYGQGSTTPPGYMHDYLAYLRPKGCCGPVGADGPISGEFYFRPGVSMPFGAGILGKVLDPGLMLQGGIRSLFYNPQLTSAWVVDFGLTTVWYDAVVDRQARLLNTTQTVQGVSVFVPDLLVTPSSLNQTYVHLGFGREHYLFGRADCCQGEPACRWGWDAGGRYGTEKLVMNEIKHRTDIVGGLYASAHADLEVPYKCCIFFFGVRGEVGYMWSDILQAQNNTDLLTVNALFNCGVRY